MNKYEPLSETGLTTVIFSKLYRPISCIFNPVFVQFGALELFDDSHARLVEEVCNFIIIRIADINLWGVRIPIACVVSCLYMSVID